MADATFTGFDYETLKTVVAGRSVTYAAHHVISTEAFRHTGQLPISARLL